MARYARLKSESQKEKQILFILYNPKMRVVKALALSPYRPDLSISIFQAAVKLFNGLLTGEDEIRFQIIQVDNISLVEILPSQVELMKKVPIESGD